jgi:hypothetical protein
MEIYASQIPALLAPLAEQQHRAEERAHIIAGYARHGSGYVCEVTETEVVKYSDGCNSTTHFPIASIDRIVITDRNGKALREYDIIRDEPESVACARSTYGMVSS